MLLCLLKKCLFVCYYVFFKKVCYSVFVFFIILLFGQKAKSMRQILKCV